MGKKILKIPEWTGKIHFNYETVHFCVVIALLLAGLLLCFVGYKYMQTFCVAVLGCIVGVIGINIGEKVTQREILKMCFFILFVLIGVAIIYETSKALLSVLRRWSGWEKVLKWQYVVTACLGAGVVVATIYRYVYSSFTVVTMLFLLLAAAGTLHGKKKAANKRIFYTYDDLCARKPICGEEDDNAGCQ